MSFKNKINLGTRIFKSIFLNQMPNYSIIYIDGRCNMLCNFCIHAAMDAGIDGITLSAGLHLGTMELIKEHPRSKDVLVGIIVSSPRALSPFLKRAAKFDRLPDYITVEGPLAGGHLGFGADDWKDYDLKSIVSDVIEF